jgi:hypothetical protein
MCNRASTVDSRKSIVDSRCGRKSNVLFGVIAMLLCLSACSEPRSFSQADAAKWVRQCGGRLLADAEAFYDSIPTDMPREQVLLRAQAFLAAESSILTLALKEGDDGQPVGLGLRPEFWNNIVAPEAVKVQWRNDTMLLVSQVLVATGIEVPDSWSAASAAPLRTSLGEAFDTIASQQLIAPWTATLRTHQRAFPSKQLFNWPPSK